MEQIEQRAVIKYLHKKELSSKAIHDDMEFGDISLLLFLQVGMFLGITTSLFPALLDPTSDIHTDLEMCSWISAVFSAAWVPGFIFSTYYMDFYGRRKTFFLGLIPGVIGLILMYFATNVYSLIVARTLQGFSAAGATGLGAVVIAEYSDPIYRGMFLNLKTTGLYLGSTIAHILGNYYHWRTLVSLMIFLVIIGVAWMWPESPSWLASKQDFDNCKKTFYWLRGESEKSEKELNEMLKAQQERPKQKRRNVSRNISTFFRKFTNKNFLLPIRIYVFAIILLETSGRHSFPAYGVQINLVCNKLRAILAKFSIIKYKVPYKTLLILYKSLAESIIAYGLSSYGRTFKSHLDQIYVLQLRILKEIVPENIKNNYTNDYHQLFHFCNIIPIHEKVQLNILNEEYFNENLKKPKSSGDTNRVTRSVTNKKLSLPRYTNLYGKRTLKYLVPHLINQLPMSLKDKITNQNLKRNLKKYFLEN